MIESIKKLCEMPIEFRKGGKSTFDLLTETGFKPGNKHEQILEISDYLR